MNITLLIVLVAAVFVSFKMAEEKGQNKFIWSGFTCLVGPLVIIVQYLVSYFKNRNAQRA